MRVEHRLSEAHRKYAQQTMSDLRAAEAEYYSLLGRAKEVELQLLMRRAALQQAMKLVEEAEGLSPSSSGYMLSPDGSLLIGETENGSGAAALVGSPGSPGRE